MFASDQSTKISKPAAEKKPDSKARRRSAAAKPSRKVAGRDREFLPAALEILETPPAPAALALLAALCAFACLGIGWSFVGRLDVFAVARGKVEVAARTKIVQPLEPGKVRAVMVEDGTKVKAGDLLVELDSAETQADVRDYSDALSAAKAELARRRAAIDAARNANDAADLTAPSIAWADDIPNPARLREDAVLIADINQLSATIGDLDKQVAGKNATTERLNLSIGYQVKLLATLSDRVNMRDTGIKLNIDTKVNLYDAQEALQKSQSALAGDQGQLIETQAAIKELDSQKRKAVSQFIADNESKSADAERKLLDIGQQLAKARAKLDRTRLLAPTDGTVQQLAITTIGQVVTTGQQLMIIVPSEGALQAQVYVDNPDIGFVKLGQEATIKVDAFPFTRYGALHGRVMRIASDAIDEQDARRTEANAAHLANSANEAPSTAAPNFVFPVTLALDEDTIRTNGVDIPLSTGMTVTAEIKTDSRRVIDYLFSPIAKVTSEALRER